MLQKKRKEISLLTSIITSLTVTVSGYSKVTVYATNYSESGYDYTEVGPLDGEVARVSTGSKSGG